MRITGGGARGIPLQVPKGNQVRPAMDRLRQAVFSSLGECVVGGRFVDLFAGSGAYGLEAWSRGAVGGTFVERDRHALAAIQINLAAVARSLGGDPAACAIAPADALTWTDASGRPARIIFVDPPYAGIGAQAKRLFAQIERLLDSSAEATVVFEMPGDLELNPAGWRCLRRLGGGGPAAASACLFRRQRP